MSKPYEKPQILSVTAAHVAELEADNAHLRKEVDFYFAQVTDNARRYQSDLEAIQAENRKLRELLDYALPIAMYAASAEEGDRIRELMREVVTP